MTSTRRIRPLRTAAITLVGAALAASSASGSSARAQADALSVSPTGTPGGGCTQTAPCSSFDRAYHVARPGQVVLMQAGTYAVQTIRADATKESASANVVFRPAPGASAVLPNSTFTISGSHVEFDQLTMDQTGCANVRVAPPCPQLLIQYPAHDVVFDGFKASRFYITGAYNVTVRNSDFGPSWDDHGIIHADTPGHRPHDIVLSNVAVHDHWNSDACWAQKGCIGAHHQGCGPTLNDAYNVFEDRMRFFNCEDLGQLVKPYKFANENIRIQNSWFGPNHGTYSLDLTSNASIPNKGLHVRNNTFTKGIAISRGIAYPQSDLIGNLIPNLSCSVAQGAGFEVAYNLVRGATACGRGSRSVKDFGLAADGLHLQHGSPAIDLVRKPPAGAPKIDIDGQVRPRRSASDAGADQREPAMLVLGKSIGEAELGMTEDAVVSFYGNPSTHKARVGSGSDRRLTYASYKVHGGWLTIAYAGGRVVGLGTSTPYYTTSAGVGVRSVRGALKKVTWVSCRKAYRQTIKGVQVFYRVNGGKKGKAVGSVAMVQPGFKQC